MMNEHEQLQTLQCSAPPSWAELSRAGPSGAEPSVKALFARGVAGSRVGGLGCWPGEEMRSGLGSDEASGQTFPAMPGRFKAGHDPARPRPYPIDCVHSIAYFYQMERCPHLLVDPVRWRSSLFS